MAPPGEEGNRSARKQPRGGKGAEGTSAETSRKGQVSFLTFDSTGTLRTSGGDTLPSGAVGAGASHAWGSPPSLAVAAGPDTAPATRAGARTPWTPLFKDSRGYLQIFCRADVGDALDASCRDLSFDAPGFCGRKPLVIPGDLTGAHGFSRLLSVMMPKCLYL